MTRSFDSESDQPSTPLERVYRYHQQTKHDFNRYARSLGYLDWANQPNPFRRFDGAPLIPLPRLGPADEPTSPDYEDLFRHGAVPAQPLTLPALSRFFEYALSLTAWKAYGGTRWALRSNPSSGNLHPTEGYLFLGDVSGLSLMPGVYHYAPQEHGLEHRVISPASLAQSLLQGFPPGAFLVGLSSIHWREAWKYGERAFRYCQHDAGHALGTLRIAAAALGWRLSLLSGLSDETLSCLYGLNHDADFEQAEREYPELAAVVWTRTPSAPSSLPLFLDPETVAQLGTLPWKGKANRLSRDQPIRWEIIDEVTAASWKSSQETQSMPIIPSAELESHEGGSGGSIPRSAHQALSAWQIIHQRRSAVAFDGETHLPKARLFRMLRRVLPQPSHPVIDRPMPWDAIPWDPTVHLVLFVHRIDGIPPGLYFLLRDSSRSTLEACKAAMHRQFLWTRPNGCPSDLPFYLLEEGDVQNLAMQVSCWQEIAGMSAFSLGMLAAFERPLQTYGPWFYRRLFWETGVIGQVLYLEAEAAGVRATGIGCFFDDPVHRLLGLFPNMTYQSLYHFTIGGPVEDPRLTTLPPYEDHLSSDHA